VETVHQGYNVSSYPDFQTNTQIVEKRKREHLLRTGLQLLYDLSDLQKKINDEIELCLPNLLEIAWKMVYRDTVDEVPEELLAIMQAPILTQWWTAGIAALSFRKYGEVYQALALAVVNQSTTKKAENMIVQTFVHLQGNQ
jgi:hypothetical protein